MKVQKGQFGKHLCRLRLAKKATLKSVASAADVSVTHLSDVERGNRAPLAPKKLAKVLDVLGADQVMRDTLRVYAVVDRGRLPLPNGLDLFQLAALLVLLEHWSKATHEQTCDALGAVGARSAGGGHA